MVPIRDMYFDDLIIFLLFFEIRFSLFGVACWIKTSTSGVEKAVKSFFVFIIFLASGNGVISLTGIIGLFTYVKGQALHFSDCELLGNSVEIRWSVDGVLN